MDSVEKILKALGLKKNELSPCDLYIAYFMNYIASIERSIFDLKNKVEYLEMTCINKERNK